MPRDDRPSAARRAPGRVGLLAARTRRILHARSLEELAGETAEAARQVLRATRAVALLEPGGGTPCRAASPPRDDDDPADPTRVVPLVDPDGRRLGAVQVWTRRRAAFGRDDEEAIAQLAECAATVAGRTLAPPSPAASDLVASIDRLVHDLRTPLTAVLSWTWALRQNPSPARTARGLDAIERSARTLARLLDGVATSLRDVPRARPGGLARDSLGGSGPAGMGDTVQRVRDAMTTVVETVAPGDTIRYAAERMDALGTGSLLVCDRERLIGIVTDRDLAVRAVATGRDPSRTAVVETMTPVRVLATAEQPVDEALARMRAHGLRRLPVVDDERRLLGVVTLADLAARATPATAPRPGAPAAQPAAE